ncbi:MAG: hypothetical protein CMF74_01560 [Maricaulis sp.]|jgi:hypothetical protein|nr:hypothetical protein [Maricaulis sp.]
MKIEKLKELYKKYGLDKSDVFKHQHYVIITRSGIDKIQAQAAIHIEYDVINCEANFCVVKARASHGYDGNKNIQTFGSALIQEYKQEIIKKKDSEGNLVDDIKQTRVGNCNTWYVMEMAEKRAMSRAVLKLTGFYELGVFGEDESEDFKRQEAQVWKK